MCLLTSFCILKERSEVYEYFQKRASIKPFSFENLKGNLEHMDINNEHFLLHIDSGFFK